MRSIVFAAIALVFLGCSDDLTNVDAINGPFAASYTGGSATVSISAAAVTGGMATYGVAAVDAYIRAGDTGDNNGTILHNICGAGGAPACASGAAMSAGVLGAGGITALAAALRAPGTGAYISLEDGAGTVLARGQFIAP